MSVVQMPARTYVAKLFEAKWENAVFKVAGTLDGFLDFAAPGGGTYPLTLEEAEGLVKALQSGISDVKANCLYEKDAIFINSKKR